MKMRNGFVTNSSSSSFVLAFKDKVQVDEFKNYCDEYDYNDFYEYVKDWIKDATDEDKERIIEEMQRYYEYEICDKRKMLEKYINRKDFTDYWAYSQACDEFESTPEFQAEMRAELEKTDFFKKKKKINKAEYLIDEMIWDSNGGMIEWMIRHGFIESEMRPYCMYVWNVG